LTIWGAGVYFHVIIFCSFKQCCITLGGLTSSINEDWPLQWAESTSSQGHSCILMRNKEIYIYNADERKYQIYWLKTVYIINSISNFDVRLPNICHSWPHNTDNSLMRFAHSWIISCAVIRDIFLVIGHHS